MRTHSEVVLTGHSIYKSKCDLVCDDVFSSPREITPWRVLLSNPFPTPSVMLRRDIKCRFKVGKWYAEDYLLWMQILLGGGVCFLFGQPLTRVLKNEYGEAGLSGELWNMEAGELQAYKTLSEEGEISNFIYIGLCIWSVTKFVRRLVIVMLRKKLW